MWWSIWKFLAGEIPRLCDFPVFFSASIDKDNNGVSGKIIESGEWVYGYSYFYINFST